MFIWLFSSILLCLVLIYINEIIQINNIIKRKNEIGEDVKNQIKSELKKVLPNTSVIFIFM